MMVDKEKKPWWHLVSALVVVLTLQGRSNNNTIGVEAFQPGGVPSRSCFSAKAPPASPCWTRLHIIESNVVPLGMSSSDESSAKPSKRKKIKEGVKKMISYPKKKIRTKLNKYRDTHEESFVRSLISLFDSTDDATGNVKVVNGEHIEGINGGTAVSYAIKHEVNGSDDTQQPTSHEAEQSVVVTLEEEAEPIIATLPSMASQVEHSKKVEQTNEMNLELEMAALVDTNNSETTQSTSSLRSATTTTPTVDLSGKWQLVVSEDFKTSYDNYLKLLGQPSLVRSVALSIIGMTTEETFQSEEGRVLTIRGKNVRGHWERTLIASGEDNPLVAPIVTADNETVMSECWWEGPIHRSWLRGVEKYGGGDFESKRYLEEDGKSLVCESTFHPNDTSREKACVVWKFRRVDEGGS